MGKKRTIFTKYTLANVTIASGNASQVGSDIPAGMNRYVIGIILGSDSGAVDQLEIMLGHTADPDAETLALLPLSATPDPQVIGSFDPEKPVLVCRPNWTGGTETKNQLGVAYKTAPIDVTMTYFDAE